MSRNAAEAVVEKMLSDIKDENSSSISHTLTTRSESQDWWSVLRYEMSIVPLMDGILDSDIILPRLVVCGVRTLCPLHYAALRGADGILRAFKEKTKIPPDVPLSGGSTALQFSCFAGNLTTVRLLLDEWKADLNRKDSYGWSSLHYASIGGQLDVVEELCRRGMNPLERDQDGTTAAYRARVFGHEAIVKYFVTTWKGDVQELLEVKQGLCGLTASGNNVDGLYSLTDRQRQQREEEKDNNSKAAIKQERRILAENDYDVPDDLITKVQCKYQPSSVEGQQSSTYSNCADGTQKVGQREKSMKKVQDLVKSQLIKVFDDDDPYLMPKEGSYVHYDTVGGNEGISNIGFRTLKYLLKNEFQKYKNSGQSGARVDNCTASSALPSRDERNVYEEIVKSCFSDKENKWVKGGQTIRHKFDKAPPLPPRSNVLDDQVFKSKEEDQKPRTSFHKEFNRASACLNFIEETQVVREACFVELVPLLGPGDWQKLALALPMRRNRFLTEEKIKSIEKQYPNDLKRQARAAFQDWNKHFGKNAKLENLLDAMKKCGFVEKIKAVEAANQKT